jgi:AraC family transcriptional regulator of arabinose operon
MQKLLKGRIPASIPPLPPMPRQPKDSLLASPLRIWRAEVVSAAQIRVGAWVSSTGSQRHLLPHTMVKDRVMDCYAAVQVLRGSGFYESDATGRVAVGAGALLWVLPGVRQSYSPEGGDWDERWVVFGGRQIDELARQGFLKPEYAVDAFGGDPEINTLMERIDAIFLRAGPLAVALASPLVCELIVVAHGLRTGLLRMDRSVDPVIAKALEAIEREAVTGLAPRLLARRLHVGYSTLRRRFKDQTSYSIKEYILRVQLRKAKELLATSGLSVAEVARECGFENALYFSRLFAQREGTPPRAFRNQHRRRANLLQ